MMNFFVFSIRSWSVKNPVTYVQRKIDLIRFDYITVGVILQLNSVSNPRII